jgi:hypothetical protein
MVNSRSRRLAIMVAAAVALPLLGAGSAVQLGKVPAKGLAPLCLISPTSPDCKDGIIS